jgi:2-polyprenyl-3-methyl-5-hydroxy-6-metoxy-1,4-benzoquinol methylase
MSCCCSIPGTDTNRFFSRLTRLYRWRFHLFGFEKSQRQLIDGIHHAGLEGQTLLEIGCGAGHLQRALLRAGAQQGVGVDLSARLIGEARLEAQRAGLAARTDYRQGDFVELADNLEPADIVVLDKVVCCYPDAERLLAAALDRTQRILALTYPRDRAATRAGVALMTALLRLAGCHFRPYVHAPASIEGWIRRAGFHPHSRSYTFAWVTEIHLRD